MNKSGLSAEAYMSHFMELSKHIGTTCEVGDGQGWIVKCTIQDMRMAYGKVQLLVSPVTGYGDKWIDGARVGII